MAVDETDSDQAAFDLFLAIFRSLPCTLDTLMIV